MIASIVSTTRAGSASIGIGIRSLPPAPVNSTFSGKVATIPVAHADSNAADYSVRIDWGDGNASAGTLSTSSDNSNFTVTGSNRYAKPGTYALRIFVVTHGATYAINGVANIAKPGHR